MTKEWISWIFYAFQLIVSSNWYVIIVRLLCQCFVKSKLCHSGWPKRQNDITISFIACTNNLLKIDFRDKTKNISKQVKCLASTKSMQLYNVHINFHKPTAKHFLLKLNIGWINIGKHFRSLKSILYDKLQVT